MSQTVVHLPDRVTYEVGANLKVHLLAEPTYGILASQIAYLNRLQRRAAGIEDEMKRAKTEKQKRRVAEARARDRHDLHLKAILVRVASCIFAVEGDLGSVHLALKGREWPVDDISARCDILTYFPASAITNLHAAVEALTDLTSEEEAALGKS